MEDEELFTALQNQKKAKKRKTIIIVSIIVAVLVVGGIIGVILLRNKVTDEYANKADILTYEATKGSISTTVSGSGTLEDVDLEDITLPANVEIEEVLVEEFASVEKGDEIATLDKASILSAMKTVQAEIDELDEQMEDASDDEVDSTIAAGVSGRVKTIYASAGDDVAEVMYEHGALIVLSLDGYMAVDIETDKLSAGDEVTVTLSDGTSKTGEVESVKTGKATILVTDNGPRLDEEVTVSLDDSEIGTGSLYIHSPLKVTGYAGTVSSIKTSLNTKVSSDTTVIKLTNTSYSTNYDVLLRKRNEAQDELNTLMQLYYTGTLTAPMTGSIQSVEYSEDESDITSEYTVATISPDKQVSVSISIDESKILSIAEDQKASVTISSIGDDAFEGTVTSVDKTATSSSGVTTYIAVVTIDKTEDMIAGMSAKVVITIEGVDDAILIPVEALHQTSSTSYVYTSYDETNLEYGGMVEVTTGLSNSSYVEITSGLNEGDTVYYEEESSQGFDFGGMGGMGDMSDLGDMAGGGEMPDMGGGNSGGDVPDMPGGSSGGNGGGGNMPGGSHD